jgi:FtsH-binding integral membrane protein
MGNSWETGWLVPDTNGERTGRRQRRASHIALVALVMALGLWIPATFASACDACGEFSGVQAIARMVVAFSPMWLLLVAVLTFRFRSALVILAVASTVMALVTFALGTEIRLGFEPLGLSSARGFVVYSIPYAVTAIAAFWGLRKG